MIMSPFQELEDRNSIKSSNSSLYSLIETEPSERRRKRIIYLIILLLILALIIILIVVLRSNKDSKPSDNKKDHLYFTQTLDPSNTGYILNSKETDKSYTNLEKDDKIYNSTKISYKWDFQNGKTEIDFLSSIPFGTNKYWDISKYDYVYLKIYSHKKTSSYLRINIFCQERTPDDESKMPNAYYSYRIQINWEKWKEIWLPLSIFEANYNPDFSKVTNVKISSSGWDMEPIPETIINFDIIAITKAKFDFNKDKIPDEQYSNILDKLTQTMILNITDIPDRSSIYFMLSWMANDVKNLYDKMKKSGDKYPFGYEIKASSDMKNAYLDIRRLAMGFSIKGSEIYQNSDLFNDIIKALDYMHNNYYIKRNEKPFSNDNWWDWEIGASNEIVKTLAMIRRNLTQDQINKYLEPVNKYVPVPGNYIANTLSLAYTSIFAAALQKDYKKIAISVEMIGDVLDKVENGEGIYEDGSFLQHLFFAYNGGYENELLRCYASIGYCLNGTYFSFNQKYQDEVYKLIINSFLPFIYKGAFFDLVRGRNIDRNEYGISTTKETMNSFSLVMEYLENKEQKKNLQSLVKYLYNTNITYYQGYLAPLTVQIITKTRNDTTKIDDFAKVYSRMDKVVSQNNDIGIGISLSSSRIGKYEAINGENLQGWYSGDGMTYIYLDPDDYAMNYWQNVNHYRLPGTTVSRATREKMTSKGKESLTPHDFVGGAYYGKNAAVAMKFSSSYPYTGYESSLMGNKGYFLFDNILVCVGNNISSNDDYIIETIIENRRINGTYYYKPINPNGEEIGYYYYLTNYGATYFPKGQNVKINAAENNFLEIYIEHGNKFSNKSYEYMLLPKVEENQIENIVKNIKVLKNDEIVTVVNNIQTKETHYIFWQKGTYENVQVDAPCVIIETASKIYVSDPTQKLKTLSVKINNKSYNFEPKYGYTLVSNKN